MSSRDYKSQQRVHLAYVHNLNLWTEVKFGAGYTMFDAAEWVDNHEESLQGEHTIKSNYIAFSNAEDATLFALTTV